MKKDNEELASVEYADVQELTEEDIIREQQRVLKEASDNAFAVTQALGSLLKQFGVTRPLRRQYIRELIKGAFRG